MTGNFQFIGVYCENGSHLAGGRVFEMEMERGGSLFMHVFVTFVMGDGEGWN